MTSGIDEIEPRERLEVIEVREDVRLDTHRRGVRLRFLGSAAAAGDDERRHRDAREVDRDTRATLADRHRAERRDVVELGVVATILIREGVGVPDRGHVAAEHRHGLVGDRTVRWRREGPTVVEDDATDAIRECHRQGAGQSPSA